MTSLSLNTLALNRASKIPKSTLMIKLGNLAIAALLTFEVLIFGIISFLFALPLAGLLIGVFLTSMALSSLSLRRARLTDPTESQQSQVMVHDQLKPVKISKINPESPWHHHLDLTMRKTRHHRQSFNLAPESLTATHKFLVSRRTLLLRRPHHAKSHSA